MVSSIQTNVPQNIVGTTEREEPSKKVPVAIDGNIVEKSFPISTPMDIFKDCCEVTFRLITSILYVPFYIFSQIFKNNPVFRFCLGDVQSSMTEGVIEVPIADKIIHLDYNVLRAVTERGEETLSKEELKFFVYVLAAIKSLEKLAADQRMNLKMVFQFGDSANDQVTYQTDRPLEIDRVIKKALEYYNCNARILPIAEWFSKRPRFFTYKYAGYTTSSPFAWIETIHGKYGLVFQSDGSVNESSEANAAKTKPYFASSFYFLLSNAQFIYKYLEGIHM